MVREDPRILFSEIKNRNIKSILMIGSGGCTALSYKAKFPHLNITLLDINKEQIALIKRKVSLLQKENYQQYFFIDETTSQENVQATLNGCGNFESLFRMMMRFIYEFVVSTEDMKRVIFDGKLNLTEDIFAHNYWSLAFELYFSDPMLITMFGQDTIQHAPQNSYPYYFQNVIEQAILDHNRSTNYFLHHILFDSYFNTALPYYLLHPPKHMDFTYIVGTIFDVEHIGSYDMIDLSNIFDWMDLGQVECIVTLLQQKMKKNAIIIFRQLNNDSDIIALFGNDFYFDNRIAYNLKSQSQSLFYNQINLGVKK